MEGAGDGALALQLTRVAQVDKQHARLAMQRPGVVQAVGGDHGQGFVDHGHDGFAHGGLLQRVVRVSSMAAGRR